MPNFVGATALEVTPEFAKAFEELSARTGIDYFNAMAKLKSHDAVPTVDEVISLNSIFVCLLVKNILAVLAAQLAASLPDDKKMSETVVRDLKKSITLFLNSTTFSEQLNSRISEMSRVIDTAP
jgi:hypothetical protein